MADIPNTQYITVKRDENGQVGVFVGGKLATHYCGVEIYDINYVKNTFAGIQKQDPNITELHVLSSKTWGVFAAFDNPSSTHGRFAWCRVKNNDGKLGGWAFVRSYVMTVYCVSKCASCCAGIVLEDDEFRRRAVLEAFDSGQKGKNALYNYLSRINCSKYKGVYKFGSYEIVIREITPKTK